MQVSWIDADEVRDLVALLSEPPARSASAAPDLNTLPETADRFGFEFLSEKPAPVAWQPISEPPPPPPAASPPPAPSGVEAEIQPDLSHIREKLRSIRDRAQEAGLLAKETPAERVAPVPSPRPAAIHPPAPEAPPRSPLHALAGLAFQPVPAAPLPVAPVAPVAASEPVPAPATSPDQGSSEQGTLVERLDAFAQASAKLTSSKELFMLDDHGDLLWGSPTSEDLLVCAKLAMNASMRSQAATLARPAAATSVQVGPGKELQLVSCPTRHGNVTLALLNAREVPAASLREALAMAMDR